MHSFYIKNNKFHILLDLKKKMMILSVMEYSGNCINTHDYLLTMTIQ